LVGAAVAILAIALCFAWWQDHFGGLGALVAEDDSKFFFDTKLVALHGVTRVLVGRA